MKYYYINIRFFPSQTNLRQDTDNLFPLPSQIPSELSTPPQSPLKSKGIPFSFVRLSGEDSEIENDPPKLSEKPSVKRTGENNPITVVAPSRKRQVHGSTRLNHHSLTFRNSERMVPTWEIRRARV